ncbi:hypothetical protein OROHE_010943 [Orobanche hederae]
MKISLRSMWLQFCNMMRFSAPGQTSLRDKAIVVAGRVTVLKKAESSKVSCPVCLDVIQTQRDEEDLRITLALHMSLWHPDDVMLQWDIITHQKKQQSAIHMPSFIVGVGMAAGFGALLLISSKHQIQHRQLPSRRRM